MITISLRVDEDVKKEAETLFCKLGLNMSTAINIFLKQSVREQAIPFKIREVPNKTTIAAIKEAEKMIRTNSGKIYDTFESLLEDDLS